jgi:tRNA 2-thiouridine synthesizing protein A
MAKLLRLDATGVACPIPVIRTRKVLRTMGPEDVLEVTCTDPMAGIDIPCLLFKTGDELLGIVNGDGILTVRIRKA